MAANLPELYKNNVGPVNRRKSDVLYTALMPLKWKITERTEMYSISVMLVQQYLRMGTSSGFCTTSWQDVSHKLQVKI